MKVLKVLFWIIISLVATVAVGFAVLVFLPSETPGQYSVKPYHVDDADKVKVILDCDNSMGTFWEVDDGMVLSYLLNKPEADLLGVTTTFGNRTYDHQKSVDMLEQMGRTDIPLFKGKQTPFDGITQAAIFMADTVAKYPGEVTIIAAGPVGNLSAAHDYDPNFFDNVKEITVMGGYTEDLALGSKDIPELNLSADYMATHDMVTSGAKVTIMTGQACLDAPFYYSDVRKLENYPANWKFFLVFWLGLQKLGLGNDYFVVWDMLPTTYVFHPEYFEDEFYNLQSTKADLSKGMLKLSKINDGHEVNVPSGIKNQVGFFKDMLEVLNMK